MAAEVPKPPAVEPTKKKEQSEDVFSEEQITQIDYALQTDRNAGLPSAEAEKRLLEFGPNELENKKLPAWLVFLSYFWGPMPVMIWVAIIIELAKGIAIGEGWEDLGVLLFLQIANAVVGFIEEHNAGNAVEALRKKLQAKAVALRDGNWKDVPVRELVPGDIVKLVIGDVVPADGVLFEGKPLSMDESALNGESLPRAKYPYAPDRNPKDTMLYMSSAVKQGENHALITATGKKTFFGRTAALINAAGSNGALQKILLRITIVLLVLSVIMCAIIFAKLMTTDTPAGAIEEGAGGSKFMRSLSVVIVILVASIPIAIEVVVTSTLAVGSHTLSSHGIIVTRLAAIEALAGMDVLCSDKTGTLTLNKLSLRDPILLDSHVDADRVLFVSAMASSQGEKQDAIDTVINTSLSAEAKAELAKYQQMDFEHFNPIDKRAIGVMRTPDGRIIKAAKGAPQVILKMAWNRDQLTARVTAEVKELASRGFRALGVAISQEPPGAPERWEMLGVLSLFDPPRHDTAETISRALESHVMVKMITGDAKDIAVETCKQLELGDMTDDQERDRDGALVFKMETDPEDAAGLRQRRMRDAHGNYIPRMKFVPKVFKTEYLNDADLPKEELERIILSAHGFAEVMPEHKFQIVKVLQGLGHVTGMTGDGVNDAPALKQADVGIAVDGATDAAKAAADLVLTKPGLSVIIDAMAQSRAIFQRMRNYLIYRIACTIQLLFFFFFASIAIDPDRSNFYNKQYNTGDLAHSPQFTLPVIALIIITILNDGCMITISHDYVLPDKRPQKWAMTEMWIVSIVLGVIACLSSLIMLAYLIGANALHPGNFMGIVWGSQGRDYMIWDEIRAIIYLKISVSDFLTLFSARTRTWFFERRLGYALLAAAIVATAISTLLALFWHDIVKMQDADMASLRHSSTAVVATWIYCILWFFVQDIIKVFTYWVMDRYFKPADEALRETNIKTAVQMQGVEPGAGAGVRSVSTAASLRAAPSTAEAAAMASLSARAAASTANLQQAAAMAANSQTLSGRTMNALSTLGRASRLTLRPSGVVPTVLPMGVDPNDYLSTVRELTVGRGLPPGTGSASGFNLAAFARGASLASMHPDEHSHSARTEGATARSPPTVPAGASAAAPAVAAASDVVVSVGESAATHTSGADSAANSSDSQPPV